MGDRTDQSVFDEKAEALVVAVDAGYKPWLSHLVNEQLGGRVIDDLANERLSQAIEISHLEVVTRLRELLQTDVDDQWTNPLSILRSSITNPTGVLLGLGIPPVSRDPHTISIVPDDHYDLGPAAFADLGPEVHSAGLAWGAAKAYMHLQRRKALKETTQGPTC